MQAVAGKKLLREHLQAMHIGSEVTSWIRKEREPQVLNVTPENVIATLHGAGINPVLMGTHGVNVYRDEARATQDVDVLVTKREVTKAIRALEAAFPYLDIMQNTAVARFVDPVSQPISEVENGWEYLHGNRSDQRARPKRRPHRAGHRRDLRRGVRGRAPAGNLQRPQDRRGHQGPGRSPRRRGPAAPRRQSHTRRR